MLLLLVGSHLNKIALEIYTLLLPANSRKEFRALGSVSIMDPPQRHSSGSRFDTPTSGNGACPTAGPALIRYLYSLSFNPIKLALVQAGTQLLQFSFLPSLPQPIGYTVVSFT